MGLPTADDMVDCALLVSKLDCQARLLVRIQLSLIARSGSTGRRENLFSAARCQDKGWWGGTGRGEEERGGAERPGLRAGCLLISAASQH